MGKTNCGGNQHVHVQQQCDEWLNAATAAKNVATRSRVAKKKNTNRRQLPINPALLDISWTSQPNEIKATKQASIKTFFHGKSDLPKPMATQRNATEDIEEPSGARGSSNQPLARKPAEVDVSIQSEALHQFDYMLTPTPNETTNSNISTFDVQSDSDTVDPLDSHPGILNCVNTCEENTKDKGSTAVQSQKAESAYFTSKQILPFGCAEQKTNCTFEQNSKSLNNEECSYDLFSSSCSENDTTLTNFSPCVSENKSMAVSSYAQSPGGQSRQFSAVTDTDQSNLSPLQSHHHAKRTYHCNSKWHKPADTLLLFSPEKENMYSANLDASNSNDYVTYSSKGSDTVTDTFKWSSQTALFSSECSDASNLEDNTCRNINRKYQTQSLTLGLSEDNFLRDRTNFIIPPPSESSESDLFDSLTFHSHPKAKHV